MERGWVTGFGFRTWLGVSHLPLRSVIKSAFESGSSQNIFVNFINFVVSLGVN